VCPFIASNVCTKKVELKKSAINVGSIVGRSVGSRVGVGIRVCAGSIVAVVVPLGRGSIVGVVLGDGNGDRVSVINCPHPVNSMKRVRKIALLKKYFIPFLPFRW